MVSSPGVKRVTIQFPADRPYHYCTQVFWFAEKIYTKIVTPGLGRMNDIDRARETLWIDVSSKRQLGTILLIVNK
jgi:hypothetical protein